MTFGEMQTVTRRKLNEATTVFFTDGDIRESLNEGYAELADATEFYERQAMVPLLKWRTYYDLSLIMPDTFLSPRRIYNPRTSRWLEPTNLRDLDYNTFVQWELTQGEPEKYLLRGNWWLGVWPKPTRDSEGLRVYYTAIPAEMTNVRDEPEFPREFHDGIVQFALSDLMSQQRETTKALGYWTKYKGYEAGLQAYADGRTKLAGVSLLH